MAAQAAQTDHAQAKSSGPIRPIFAGRVNVGVSKLNRWPNSWGQIIHWFYSEAHLTRLACCCHLRQHSFLLRPGMPQRHLLPFLYAFP